jgi:hypothetical protein
MKLVLLDLMRLNYVYFSLISQNVMWHEMATVLGKS